MKRSLKVFLAVLMTAYLSYCQNNERTRIREVVVGRVGDSIVFPSSIYCANRDTLKVADFKQTLIVYTDGDCGKCIADLYQWSLLLKEHKELFKYTQQKFIIYSNNFERFEYTVEKAGVSLPFYYDSTNCYLQQNNIDDPLLHTLLLDQNNIIRLVGSPIYNSSMLDLFKKVLSE